MAKLNDTRVCAAKVLVEVSQKGRSLGSALEQFTDKLNHKDKAFVQELCYGSIRHWITLQSLVGSLLSKPLKHKDADVFALMLLGVYQLLYMRVPDHAAVGETVNAVVQLKKPWAKKLVNGLLRNVQRDSESLLANIQKQDYIKYNHPEWLFNKIRSAWPNNWQQILEANDSRPPLVLRVNKTRISVDQCLTELNASGIEASRTKYADEAVVLASPCDITELQLFREGKLSVQDSAAQLAASLLETGPTHRVLDVCAAPGGKTNHILELMPTLSELVAVEIDAKRIERIRENLGRLDQQATVIQGDATQPAQWWDQQPFDRILLDVPCSATGVIRRHPDIKLLRSASDIASLVKLQQQILLAIWPLLRPGGMLLYATCSILPEENEDQVARFVTNTMDAKINTIEAAWGVSTGAGRQILTGSDNMDGFYYARLSKLIQS